MVHAWAGLGAGAGGGDADAGRCRQLQGGCREAAGRLQRDAGQAGQAGVPSVPRVGRGRQGLREVVSRVGRQPALTFLMGAGTRARGASHAAAQAVPAAGCRSKSAPRALNWRMTFTAAAWSLVLAVMKTICQRNTGCQRITGCGDCRWAAAQSRAAWCGDCSHAAAAGQWTACANQQPPPVRTKQWRGRQHPPPCCKQHNPACL